MDGMHVINGTARETHSSSEMNWTPVLSQSSHRPLSSSGESIAPVGLAGDERMRPLRAGSPDAARAFWAAASSTAVRLYSALTATLTTSHP